MLRPDQCDDVRIRGIRIHNHANFNNDGIDVVDCHRVVISDCLLDCEDDAICLKSEAPRGVQDVTVTNCVVSSHASALKLGTASYGSFERIAVSNCVIRPSTARETLHPLQLVDGLAGIDLASVDGATLRNVSFSNVVMDGVETPLFVKLGSRGRWYRNPEEADPREGIIDNLTFANIQAVNAGEVSSAITGYPGRPVHNVKLQNVDLSFKGAGTREDAEAEVPEHADRYPFSRMFGVNLPSYGLYMRHVRDVWIDGLAVRPPVAEARPALVADDVHGLHVSGFRTGHPGRTQPKWRALRSSGVRVNGSTAPEVPAS
jgi:hypothetical protein